MPPKVSVSVIVAGVVAILGLLVALIVGLSLSDNLDDNSTPLVVDVIGLASLTVPALMALNKADQAKNAAETSQSKVEEMHHDLGNGLLKEKVTEALNERDQIQTSETNNIRPVKDEGNG